MKYAHTKYHTALPGSGAHTRILIQHRALDGQEPEAGTSSARASRASNPVHLLRLWEFYFCHCEGSFAERVLGDVQVLLTKPLARRAVLTPRSPALPSHSIPVKADAG